MKNARFEMSVRAGGIFEARRQLASRD